MGLDSWPAGCEQNNGGNAAAIEVLLVLEILVSGDKDLKTRLLCCGDEIAVLKLRPTLLVRCRYIMVNQRLAQRSWSALVKENLHSRSFESTPSCMLKYGARLLGGDAREPFNKVVKGCVVFKVLKES